MKTETKKMTFTPGPWSIHAGDLPFHFNVSQTFRENKRGNLTAVNVVRNVRKEANARLIAAAPELLEAVKKASRDIRYYINTPEIKELVDVLEAVIVEAEGV